MFDKWTECLNKDKSKTKLIKQKRMYEGIKIIQSKPQSVIFKKIIENTLIIFSIDMLELISRLLILLSSFLFIAVLFCLPITLSMSFLIKF